METIEQECWVVEFVVAVVVAMTVPSNSNADSKTNSKDRSRDQAQRLRPPLPRVAQSTPTIRVSFVFVGSLTKNAAVSNISGMGCSMGGALGRPDAERSGLDRNNDGNTERAFHSDILRHCLFPHMVVAGLGNLCGNDHPIRSSDTQGLSRGSRRIGDANKTSQEGIEEIGSYRER